MVRALVSLALAVLIMPSQWSATLPYPGSLLVYVVVIGGELLVGLVLGMGISILLGGIQMAGDLMSRVGGLTLSDVFDPTTSTNVPLVLATAGPAEHGRVPDHRRASHPAGRPAGHVPRHPARRQRGACSSARPGGGAGPGLLASLVEMFLVLVTQSFHVAIRAAAPVVTAVLLATLVLGLISRTLPQLNVMVVGFGLNAMITFGVFFLSLGAALLVFQDQVVPTLQILFQTLRIPHCTPSSLTFNHLTWRNTTATKRRKRLRTAVSRRGKKARWPRARTWPPPPCCWSGWRPCYGWAAPSSKCWGATRPTNWAANPGSRPTRSSSSPMQQRMAYALACCLLPIFAVLMFAGIAAHVLQGGFLFLPEKLAPDLTRLDPLQGFARLFSLTNLVRLLMGLLKMAVVAGVAYASLYGQREKILGLAAMTTPEIAAFLAQVLIWTGMKIALALLLLAVLDYGFQWWKHERDLRMTPQEVREELRNLEANPQMAARRKQVQRELALHGIASAVPKADAVIANATELAVAIQYDPQTMAAPLVVAKGAGAIAARIRKLASEHGIPIVESKVLAQALYREVEIDRPIPQGRYAAVGEVLAQANQLKGKKTATAETR